jgi:periplasmic copper chaperone A
MDWVVMRKCLALAVVAAWCCHVGGASAHSHKQKGLEIVHPWCFASGDTAAKTAAVYMLIKNRTKRPDRLIGATSPSAQSVELRRPAASPGGGIRAATGVALKGRHEVALKRDGPHLVVSGLAAPLAPYDSFPMTLIFQRAGKIEIEVVVEEAVEPTTQ